MDSFDPSGHVDSDLQQMEGHNQLCHMTHFILKQSGQIVPYMHTLSIKRIAKGKPACRDVKADEASHNPTSSQDLNAVLEGLLGP